MLIKFKSIESSKKKEKKIEFVYKQFKYYDCVYCGYMKRQKITFPNSSMFMISIVEQNNVSHVRLMDICMNCYTYDIFDLNKNLILETIGWFKKYKIEVEKIKINDIYIDPIEIILNRNTMP